MHCGRDRPAATEQRENASVACPTRECRGRLLGVLRAAGKDDLPAGKAPPVLHMQHIYTKIGVSTRGAAALYAIEHGILAAGA
jgi:hypothetical protein